MNSNANANPVEETSEGMGIFERYLSLWVALAIIAGVALGQLAALSTRNSVPLRVCPGLYSYRHSDLGHDIPDDGSD